MPLLMHQNMRVFGGGAAAADRTQSYHHQFAAANQVLAERFDEANPVAVVGFTEITNRGAALEALGQIAGGVNATLLVLASCGRMALAQNNEFVGIAVDDSYQLLSVGRILLEVGGQHVNVFRDTADIGDAAAFANWCTVLPADATLDYRGVVYVVVQREGEQPIGVGFIHNRAPAQDQTAVAMQQIPNMLNLIAEDPALNPMIDDGDDDPAQRVVIGGDFNVLPQQRGFSQPVSHGMLPLELPHYDAGDHPPQAGGTTWSGSLYDYWHPRADEVAAAAIYTGTLNRGPQEDAIIGDGRMSDHVASVARLA